MNAIERNSKPLNGRIGQFVERICKGAFNNAINRNDDIHILLNHDWKRDLGSTKRGNLKLHEDNIGLYARAIISDREVIDKARNGELVGWSFGFSDRDVANTIEHGMPTRAVKDLDLYEVSILDRAKRPAYDGNLLTARSETEKPQFNGANFIDKVIINQSEPSEKVTQRAETQPEQPKKLDIFIDEPNKSATSGKPAIDYSKFEKLIKKLKGEL